MPELTACSLDRRPSTEEWDRTLDINLKGTYLTVHFTVPHLKAAGGGSIIITSSVNGTRSFSFSGASAYSTSKGAQVAFMKMMALELGRYGIRCNAICPGPISTNINESTQEAEHGQHRHPNAPPGRSSRFEQGMGYCRGCGGCLSFSGLGSGTARFGVEYFVDGGGSLLR
jgi:NAD(P)-dependent dehydrogenase (short-subunit alcohol dehydrogenase family)